MLAFNFSPVTHDPFMQTLEALLADPLAHSHLRCGVAPSLACHVAASVAVDKDAYVVTVQAPGLKADDLRISLDQDILTIAASTETAQGTFSFKRQAKLPNADAKSTTATHKDGVLMITLKKLAPPETVHITVSNVLTATVSKDDDEDEARAKPYTLTVAAPGVKAGDIRIEASQAALLINGETSSAHGTFSIYRTYKLPRDADANAATATHIDGILSITLPTKPTPEATAIKISMEAPEEEEEEAGPSDGKTPEAITVPKATPSIESSEVPPKAEEEEWLAEWDTMLDDLAEMGFDDRESNRAALAKHSGSIKGAVKELVASRARA